MGSIFFGLQAVPGILLRTQAWVKYLGMLARAYQALEFLQALLEPSKFYNLLNPVELIKKAQGLGQNLGRGSVKN